MFHWNRRVVLILALVLVGLLTANFAVRAFQHTQRLRTRPDEPIQAWMNVPYIAHSYHVPPNVVAQAIGLSPDRRDRRPLHEIAAEQGRTVDALKADILAAVQQERATHGPPPPQPPAPPSEGTVTP